MATTFQFFKIRREPNGRYTRSKGYVISGDTELWWDPRQRGGGPRPTIGGESSDGDSSTSAPWRARLILSERFFEEILTHPIPVNLRALAALQATLAMDLHVWLTYLLHALTKPTTVPWKALHLQCGSQTPRVPVFRRQVIQKLLSILTVCPEARVQEAKDRSGLTLRPSPPHIPRAAP